jgi:hypothetical protein
MVGAADLKHMNHLMREFDALRLGEIEDFIGAFREHRKQLRGIRPAQIDMLSRFGISMSETQHSAFLAWLLDAEGSHNQGDLFLRTFLDVCRPKPEVGIPEEYHVQTEFWGGRSSIDILLYQPGEFLLYIENKTASPDTWGQLSREFEDMRRLGQAFAIPTHRQVAVYLTPTGRPHPDPVYREEWYSASYRDLAQALGALLPRLEDVRPGNLAGCHLNLYRPLEADHEGLLRGKRAHCHALDHRAQDYGGQGTDSSRAPGHPVVGGSGPEGAPLVETRLAFLARWRSWVLHLEPGLALR